MITVYHLTSSRSERIVWLMEELGLDYELERFQREQGGAAPEAMKGIHALGRAPVIRDGDTVLAESGAIVEYIVQRYGGGHLTVRPDAAVYARYLYWLHFAEGSLMSLLPSFNDCVRRVSPTSPASRKWRARSPSCRRPAASCRGDSL